MQGTFNSSRAAGRNASHGLHPKKRRHALQKQSCMTLRERAQMQLLFLARDGEGGQHAFTRRAMLLSVG